jgi:hypothetical protein
MTDKLTPEQVAEIDVWMKPFAYAMPINTFAYEALQHISALLASHAALVAELKAREDVTAWLIEKRSRIGSIEYWSGVDNLFVSEVDRAVRLQRREDALKIILWMSTQKNINGLYEAEHMWPAAPTGN